MFVRRERSACPSSTARREPAVSPEKIDDVVDASGSRSSDPDVDEGAVAEVDDAEDAVEANADNGGRDKGK